MIHLSEIFYSLQGEGYHTGTPAIFLRLAGCNLACNFCDTDFSVKIKLEPEGLLERISGYPGRFVVITGGEPTLQAQALKPLVRELKTRGYFTTVETNGDYEDTFGVDWVTVSPKLSQKGRWTLRKGNELKLVYEGQDLQPYLDSHFDHYYLQPKEIRTLPWGAGQRDEAASDYETRRTTQAVLASPPWKLSLQTHKILGVP